MSRNLFAAACKRKRKFTEMTCSLASTEVNKNDIPFNPIKKFSITGIRDNTTSQSSLNIRNLEEAMNKEKDLLNQLKERIFQFKNNSKGNPFNPNHPMNPFDNNNSNNSHKPDSNGKKELINPFLIVNPFPSNNIYKNDIHPIKNPFPNIDIPDLSAPTNFSDNPFIKNQKKDILFNINFNLNKAPAINKFLEEDGEESEGAFNPEEEVPILDNSFANNNTKKATINENKDSLKYYEHLIEDFSLYCNQKKKYISKGKGTLSIEEFKNEKSGKVNYIIVFRNVGVKAILFQGNVVKGKSYVEKENKKGEYIVLVYNIFSQDNTAVINNVLRVEFLNEELRGEFIDKFVDCVKKEESEKKKCETPKVKEIKIERDEKGNLSSKMTIRSVEEISGMKEKKDAKEKEGEGNGVIYQKLNIFQKRLKDN